MSLCLVLIVGKCSWGENCRFLHEGTPKVDHPRDRKMMGPAGFMGGMPLRGHPHMRGGMMFPPDFPEPIRGHGHEFG